MTGQPDTPLALSRVLLWSGAQVRYFALVMVFANIAIPAAMFGYASYADVAYWRMFRGETHAVDWFSSLQMILIAMVAYANYQLAGVARRLGGPGVARTGGMWAVFALGFLVLALDERFNIHEALRDTVFRPSGMFTNVDWMVSGDVGLYLFFLIGVVCSLSLRGDLVRTRHGMALFIAALVLAFPTFVIDSLRDSAMAGWPWRRFLDYTFEEVGEIWAQLLFLLSFLSVFAWRLEGMSSPREDPP